MAVTPRSVKLDNGATVVRKDKIFVASRFQREIPCAPYDDHFIYETDEVNRSAFMCTCGSPSVIANIEGTGDRLMLICLYHAYKGVHATGGRTWI